MSFEFQFRCVSPKCGRSYPADFPRYKCQCGSVMMPEKNLDYLKKIFPSMAALHFQVASLDRALSPNDSQYRWRHLVAPGFPEKYIVTHREGNNNDISDLPDELAKGIGTQLYIIREGQNPTGSFKDRGMSFLISYCRYLMATKPELGIVAVACASTGDTAASMAAYSGSTNGKVKAVILMAQGKVSGVQGYQCLRSGAVVLWVKAEGFDKLMKLVDAFCQNDFTFLLANSENPIRLIMQETITLDFLRSPIFKGGLPDWIVVPSGNGGNVTAQMNIAKTLYQLGLISKLPGIIIAQSERASTLVRWIESGFAKYQPGNPANTSLASAACIQDPVSFPRINYLRPGFDLKGFSVSEEEIAETRGRFSRCIIDVCPHTAVAITAAIKARSAGVIKDRQLVGVISTATDMKFSETGMAYHQTSHRFANQPIVIEPSLEAIQNAVAIRV